MPVLEISLAGSPNSCLVKIGKQHFRSLVDSGAEESLMHRRVYQNLKEKPKLQRKKVYLQSVNGESLIVDGYINITFEMKGEKNVSYFLHC